jgi:hypothetical protein
MMNFSPLHDTFKITVFSGVENKTLIFNRVRVVVSGNFLIISSEPTRDEVNNLKNENNKVFNLNDVIEYDTTTKYYPEKGLDNAEQLND